VLKRVLRRPEDFASRYGGEEFAAILVDVDRDAAITVAESIREQVLAERIEHSHSSAADVVSVSIGVAHLFPHLSERSEKGFVQIADQALYAAKQRGRNRVEGAVESSAAGTGVFKVGAASTEPHAAAP
jgi:diguanylate cyclase (GGDEF)-like protein